MGEFEFIAWLRRKLAQQTGAQQRLRVPPGDDCAELGGAAAPLLFAADMLMEGVHFDLDHMTAEQAGRKALAVNLSDIAAMAGTPLAVTVSLAVPTTGGERLARAVMDGMLPLAAELDVAIAGGDTNSWGGRSAAHVGGASYPPGPLVISVSVIGHAHPCGSVTRAGARPGDWIIVSGALGGSLASGRHWSFAPRVGLAARLHTLYRLSAMIDLSDGLAADLRHILTASGVDAQLTRAAIPVHSDVPPEQALAQALSGGEDFELCFTLPAPAAARLLAGSDNGGVRLTKVGVVTPRASPDSAALVWDDGRVVAEQGYRHALLPP